MELTFPRTGDFHGNYTRIGTDEYQLVAWEADETQYARQNRHIRADPDEDYRFAVPLTKRFVVRQHNEVICLRPGLGGLFAYDKPFDGWHDAGTRMMILTISRKEIESRLEPAPHLGVPLDLSKGLGRIVHDLVLGLLCSESGAGSPAISSRRSRSVLSNSSA